MNTHTTIEELPFLCKRRDNHTCIIMVELLLNGVFCWNRPRLYNEDPRLEGIELRESLETAVEDS
jgi:hypothetical protein